MPQDLPVLVSGYENGYEHFHQPKIIKVIARKICIMMESIRYLMKETLRKEYKLLFWKGSCGMIK